MTFLSGRRAIAVCIVSAAAAVAAVAPGTASASSDLLTQCAGSNIQGNGSSFQAPILVKWSEEFNTSANLLACNSSQGAKLKPTVKYLSGGSGACLHAWGAESSEFKVGELPFCGTDEAPNETQKKEIESHKTGGEESRSRRFRFFRERSR